MSYAFGVLAAAIERRFDGARCVTEGAVVRAEIPVDGNIYLARVAMAPIGATGFALYFGFILVAWWLVAAASGPSAYANVQWFFGSFIGRLVLFGYTWGLIHHTLGGIRHLIWDTGHGLDLPELQWLARATIGGSIVLTLVVWAIGYLVMGGAR